MASVFDAFTGRVNTAEGGQVFNATPTKPRVWLGEGDFVGFRLNAQTTAGSGIKVYDGWNNGGRLIWVEAAPTVSQTAWYGPTTPHRFKDGLFIEFLGTGQDIDVMVAE